MKTEILDTQKTEGKKRDTRKWLRQIRILKWKMRGKITWETKMHMYCENSEKLEFQN